MKREKNLSTIAVEKNDLLVAAPKPAAKTAKNNTRKSVPMKYNEVKGLKCPPKQKSSLR